ncbi:MULTISPECIES: hypothetical protein [Burkholderia]|uniref:hypothetical protein n=1 Tax=Burkholderia TaxID=32008 RepID=UPI000A9D41A4|nr:MULTISPECIES: hypothetical protein [Burkholderia]UOB60177.1 hypothetical protein MRS60_34270 [Burkholderia pyrrocinia]
MEPGESRFACDRKWRTLKRDCLLRRKKYPPVLRKFERRERIAIDESENPDHA